MISYTAKWQRKMKNGSIEYGERIFFKLKSAEKFLEKKLKKSHGTKPCRGFVKDEFGRIIYMRYAGGQKFGGKR